MEYFFAETELQVTRKDGFRRMHPYNGHNTYSLGNGLSKAGEIGKL